MASKAANGYSAFCRQDFVGIDYGMLDCAAPHAPLPDYYGGLLWSKLMGRRVLGVSVASAAPAAAAGQSVRAYAHCAANITGAVTVLLLNIQTTTATVNLGDIGGSTQHRSEWHLTGPDGTNAPLVALNGVTLQYNIDSSSGEALLPDLGGRIVARVVGGNDVVEMAPASIVFVQVSSGAAATALCTHALPEIRH
jgi:heparanase 1